MRPSPNRSLLIALILMGNLIGIPQSKAGVPVVDFTNIQVNTNSFLQELLHKTSSAADRALDFAEQQLQTGIVDNILAVNTIIQGINDEIMRAAGTLEAIANLPNNIMDDIFGMLGSVKDTLMQTAGIAGSFENLKDVFTGIADFEAMGESFMSQAEALIDWGDFGNAYNAYSTMRGIETRTAIELLDQVDQERETVSDIINTFENSENQAAIAKGHAQMTAAVHKEISRANEMAAIAAQTRAAESWSREESARARAARAQAATFIELMNPF